MARETFDSWIPVEYSADAIQSPARLSAVENAVPALPMNSNSKVFPRSGAAQVVTTAKGAAIGEDTATNTALTLTAVKFDLAFRIANEDLDDGLQDIVAVKQGEFARSYAKTFDNACLGTSAVGNGGTVPFNSLYYVLKNGDTPTGYTAGANVITTATGTPVSYDNLNALIGLAEAGAYYAPDSSVVIAHPSVRATLRGIKSSTGSPIFTNADFGGNGATPDRLFGLPIVWSLGAAVSATASGAPTGNKLIAVVNPSYLINATRMPVSANVNNSLSALTDETLLILRTRKAFGVSQPAAHAVLEITP